MNNAFFQKSAVSIDQNSYRNDSHFVFKKNRRLNTINEKKQSTNKNHEKKSIREKRYSESNRHYSSLFSKPNQSYRETNFQYFQNNPYHFPKSYYPNENGYEGPWYSKLKKPYGDLSIKEYFYFSPEEYFSYYLFFGQDSYRQNSYKHSVSVQFQKTIRLRSTKIMKFDSKERSVAFFIRRFQHIVEIEGEGPVFRILFMCLKRAALDWHTSLFFQVRAEMNTNLKIWKNEFLKKYRFNRFETLKQAEKLKFRFDEQFILSEYFFKKTNHLQNARIIDENTMIRYLWNELNAQLILIIPFRKNENILKNFEKRIRMNE